MKKIINKKIKAAILEKIKKPLVVKKLKILNIKDNQVLVKLYYSGICQSQLMEINGGRNNSKYLPHMLGHEASGKVIKTGKNVKKVKKGDEVILSWIKSFGKSCKGGFIEHKNKKINYGPLTTFSNYTLASEDRVVKKPIFINRKIATLFGCALSTGAGMVLKYGKISKNKKVLIYGLGGVGFCSLITLLAKNHKNVYAYDTNLSRSKLAEKFGAKKIDLEKSKKKYLSFFDVCIETCGKTKTIENGISLIKDSGKLIFASHPPKNQKIKIYPHDLIKGKKIIGSWGGSTNLDRDLKSYFQIIKNKINLFNFLIHKIYNLSEINIAIKQMQKGKVIRPLIKFV